MTNVSHVSVSFPPSVWYTTPCGVKGESLHPFLLSARFLRIDSVVPSGTVKIFAMHGWGGVERWRISGALLEREVKIRDLRVRYTEV